MRMVLLLLVLPAALIQAQDVKTGIDVLVEHEFRELLGKRAGVITNHSGLDRRGRRTVDLLAAAPGVKLVAIFSPEHGLEGTADKPVPSGRDAKTGLPVYSLYGDVRKPAPEMLKGVDTLVYDIQDVGTRFYTYIATLGLAMEEAGPRGIEVVVLDRPNPVNALAVEGPVQDDELLGFLAYFPIPSRYGMTIGELALMFNAERKMGVKLVVVPMAGWKRSQWFDQTGLRWVDPSPALRNMHAVALYGGFNMLYITGAPDISLGRGTDAPYEMFGAPWVEDERALAAYLNARRIPGVSFLPVRFTPKASAYAGKECGGVFVHLLDRNSLNTARLGIELLSAMWKLYPRRFNIDGTLRRVGSKKVLEAIKAGADPAEIERSWQKRLEAFRRMRERYLIYK